MNETDSTLPPLLARITHPSMVADLSLADKQILASIIIAPRSAGSRR